MAPTTFLTSCKAAIAKAAKAAYRAADRAVRHLFPRRSPRLLAREPAHQLGIQPRSNPRIALPTYTTNLQSLPVDIIFEIASHMMDEKTHYIFSKRRNGNWRLVIDPDRPGHNPPGGRAVCNPRRYGFQFLHHYRPTANLVAAYPEFAAVLALPPALTPMPLEVFSLINGVLRPSPFQYEIQEQHINGWGVITEVTQGRNVSWPRAIPFML